MGHSGMLLEFFGAEKKRSAGEEMSWRSRGLCWKDCCWVQAPEGVTRRPDRLLPVWGIGRERRQRPGVVPVAACGG